MSMHEFESCVGLTAAVLLCEDIELQTGLTLEMNAGTGKSENVFRAHFSGRGHLKCAVKLFDVHALAEKGEDEDNFKSFLKEVSILQTLKHRHIISDVLALECCQFRAICTPYYPGGSLRHRLETLSESSVWKFFTQIVSALHFLHHRGIVHRDIKPNNVLISDKGEAILTDLSVAKTTIDGMITGYNIAGSNGYKAPELGKARTVNLFKCDAYSLGATLWSMYFQEHRILRKIDCIHCLEYNVMPTLYRILFHRLCHHVVEKRWSVFDLVVKSPVILELRKDFDDNEWN